jgi:hypothetical protein
MRDAPAPRTGPVGLSGVGSVDVYTDASRLHHAHVAALPEHNNIQISLHCIYGTSDYSLQAYVFRMNASTLPRFDKATSMLYTTILGQSKGS